MSIAAVFQIGSLGDTIVSIPALLSIRELLPDCSGYLLISRFENQQAVTASHVFDLVWKPEQKISYLGSGAVWERATSTFASFLRLRQLHPRYAVYLMPGERTKRQIDRDRRFFRAAGVRELIGFQLAEPPESSSVPNLSETQAYLRFHRLWGQRSDEKFAKYSSVPLITPSQAAREHVRTWLSNNRCHAGRRLVALSPYSKSQSKDLSQRAAADLVARLEGDLGVEVVILGGAKDRVSAADLCSQAGAGSSACGVFSLEESAALLEMCSVAVCVDSGPMHLAGALNIPCVVVFSRMNWQLARWFPLGGGHTVLYRDVPCAGCRLARCNVEGHPCMDEISVDQIVATVAEKLAGCPITISTVDGTNILPWPRAAEATKSNLVFGGASCGAGRGA